MLERFSSPTFYTISRDWQCWMGGENSALPHTKPAVTATAKPLGESRKSFAPLNWTGLLEVSSAKPRSLGRAVSRLAPFPWPVSACRSWGCSTRRVKAAYEDRISGRTCWPCGRLYDSWTAALDQSLSCPRTGMRDKGSDPDCLMHNSFILILTHAAQWNRRGDEGF